MMLPFFGFHGTAKQQYQYVGYVFFKNNVVSWIMISILLIYIVLSVHVFIFMYLDTVHTIHSQYIITDIMHPNYSIYIYIYVHRLYTPHLLNSPYWSYSFVYPTKRRADLKIGNVNPQL